MAKYFVELESFNTAKAMQFLVSVRLNGRQFVSVCKLLTSQFYS